MRGVRDASSRTPALGVYVCVRWRITMWNVIVGIAAAIAGIVVMFVPNDPSFIDQIPAKWWLGF